MKIKSALIVTLLLILGAYTVSVYAEATGERKKLPKPHEYGNVIMNNFSTLKEMPPVVFMHWVHRSKFTCRLCHVDMAIMMKVGETKISCNDIKNGMYCGICHNGTIAFARVEKGPKGTEIKKCDFCHSLGMEVTFKNNFYAFKKTVPSERFGNGIDWQKAEETGAIKIKDFMEGISIKRKKIATQKDVDIVPKEKGMPEILFSHKKHSDWNGCEVCHPDIFGVKAKSSKYTMEEIFNGKYCGMCHDKVAFPNLDCQRCHTKEVF